MLAWLSYVAEKHSKISKKVISRIRYNSINTTYVNDFQLLLKVERVTQTPETLRESFWTTMGLQLMAEKLYNKISAEMKT